MTEAPPHDLEAEEAVLGALMLSGTATVVLPLLEPADFYSQRHRIIYATIRRLATSNSHPDPILVARQLRAEERLEDIGGHEYLHALVASVPTVANAEHYARIIAEAAILRALIDLATRSSAEAYGHPRDIGALLASTARDLTALAIRHRKLHDR